MVKKSEIQIFLAHAHEDKEAVLKLYERLKKAGYKPWMDKKDLIGGQEWKSVIRKEISKSQLFIACFSRHSTTKQGFVQREFRMALSNAADRPPGSIYIIPIRMDECEIPDFGQDEYGINLRNYHWIDYWEVDGLEKLERAIAHQSLRLTDEEISPIEQPIEQPIVAQKEEERIRQQQETERLRRQRSRRQFLKWTATAGLGGGLLTVMTAREIFKGSPPIPSISVAKPKYIPSNEGAPKVYGSPLWKVKFETVTVDVKGKVVERDSNKQSKFFKEDLSNSINLEMIYIPRGKFLMGTEDEEIEKLVKKFNWDGIRREKGQHEVTVQPFFMGKFQVTQAQWRAITSLPKVSRDLEFDPSKFKGDERPVESVSWDDAEEFCQRLSKQTGKEYRLPTEAEWEYACRGVTEPLELEKGESYPPFYFGETITSDLANYNASRTYADEPEGEYRQETTPVGQFPPNAFGLYDMHGNVWEWCEDDWHDNYQDAPNDGTAWLSRDSNMKVSRGGAWKADPWTSRSAYRDDTARDDRSLPIGVRVACVVPRTT